MPRRPQSKPPGLSRERILAAALDVAGREGVDSLSMRRLAQELDVWPMGVYRYFDDKDALLDAMAAHTAGQVTQPRAGEGWREQMHELLGDAQRRIAASPGVAARLPRAFLDAGALKLPEAGLAILAGAGFGPGEAASVWRTLWSYTLGFATFRVGTAGGVRVAVEALPEDAYPALAQAGDELARALASDEEFAVGLDRVLDGVVAGSPEELAKREV